MSCAVTNLMSLPCLLNFTTSLRDDGQRPKLSSRLFFKHALPSFLTFTENRFVKMKPGMELRYCTLPSCLRSQGRGGGLQQGGRDAVCLYKLKEVTVKHGTCQVTGNSFETWCWRNSATNDTAFKNKCITTMKILQMCESAAHAKNATLLRLHLWDIMLRRTFASLGKPCYFCF